MNDLRIVLAAGALLVGTLALGLISDAPDSLERHSSTMELRGDDSEWTRPFFETRRTLIRSATLGQS